MTYRGSKTKKDAERAVNKARAALESAQADLDYYNSLVEEQILADSIHALTCKYNHTDACGYMYADWSKPNREKLGELAKAIDILAIVSMETAEEIIEIMKRSVYNA